jgi:hypothetical protein
MADTPSKTVPQTPTKPAPSQRRPHGTPGAELGDMKTQSPSEAWTIPLHVVMWTVLTVGFIMVWVVLLMH